MLSPSQKVNIARKILTAMDMCANQNNVANRKEKAVEQVIHGHVAIIATLKNTARGALVHRFMAEATFQF
jgi:hypothetical protein